MAKEYIDIMKPILAKNPMDFIGGTVTNKDRHYLKTVADKARQDKTDTSIPVEYL
jgi:hypothetical protein